MRVKQAAAVRRVNGVARTQCGQNGSASGIARGGPNRGGFSRGCNTIRGRFQQRGFHVDSHGNQGRRSAWNLDAHGFNLNVPKTAPKDGKS